MSDLLEAAFRVILRNLEGEDDLREGLVETPARMARAFREYTAGYGIDTDSLLKTFDDGAEGYDEIVIVQDIPVYSLCEHHLAPFFGVATVAYIPDGKIVGLSKFARLVDAFARRLQVQERLTVQVADAIERALCPKAVLVIVRCRHLCMEARGAKVHGVKTTTSAVRGLFKISDAARAEALALIDAP